MLLRRPEPSWECVMCLVFKYRVLALLFQCYLIALSPDLSLRQDRARRSPISLEAWILLES